MLSFSFIYLTLPGEGLGSLSGQSLSSLTFMWPCIVTNFFVIKPTRCTNFTNLFCHETTCFGQFVCPSSGVYSLYTQQWYVIQVCRQLSSRTCSKAVYKPVCHIPLLSVQWINSWWWTDELFETCRVSWQNKFVKLVYLGGFITKKRVCQVSSLFQHLS